MAALTTLSRLLEMKVLELEGEEGSGPLENDVALLQAWPMPFAPCLFSLDRGVFTNVTKFNSDSQHSNRGNVDLF